VTLPAIAATTVGSFPRPASLADHQGGRVTFRLEGEALRQALDDATLTILNQQQEVGLDLLTDGEQRRRHFLNHVIAAWDGIDVVNLGLKTFHRGRSEPRHVARVTGKISRRSQAIVEDLRFAKAHASRPIKMAVPGPLTIVDSTLDETYGDEARLAMDVARALNLELLDLQAAGCDVLQLDEPAMTRYHEKVADYGASALDRCLEGIHVPTIVHLCYGYPGTHIKQHEYQYPRLLEELMKTRIGGFGVEFARSNYDPAVLQICRGRLVMFGSVDPGLTPLPPVSLVVDRVREVLKYVPGENLLLAPDCGLMMLSPELSRAKTQLLVDVARVARRAI